MRKDIVDKLAFEIGSIESIMELPKIEKKEEQTNSTILTKLHILKDLKHRLVNRAFRESLNKIIRTFTSLPRIIIFEHLVHKNSVTTLDLKEYGLSKQLSNYHLNTLVRMRVLDFDEEVIESENASGKHKLHKYFFTKDFYFFFLRLKLLIKELSSLRSTFLNLLDYFSEKFPNLLPLTNEKLRWWEHDKSVEELLKLLHTYQRRVNALISRLRLMGVNA